MLHLILSFSFLLSHLTLGLAGLTAMSGLMLPAYGAWTTLVAVSHPHVAGLIIGWGVISGAAIGSVTIITWALLRLSTGVRG